MSGNTPGRIYFRANGEANSYSLIDQDAIKWVMSLLVNGEHTTARQAEILERMAACWNACEGIPTARIEAGAVDVLAYSMELKAQRDELLTTIIAAASLAHHGTAVKNLLDEAINEVSRGEA